MMRGCYGTRDDSLAISKLPARRLTGDLDNDWCSDSRPAPNAWQIPRCWRIWRTH